MLVTVGIYFYLHTNVLTSRSAGNLHLNVVADTYSSEIQDALEPFIYELVGV